MVLIRVLYQTLSSVLGNVLHTLIYASYYLKCDNIIVAVRRRRCANNRTASKYDDTLNVINDTARHFGTHFPFKEHIQHSAAYSKNGRLARFRRFTRSETRDTVTQSHSHMCCCS